MGIANKALDNKSDEKIVVPEIENKKRKKKEGKKEWDSHKPYFLTMDLDHNHVQRYVQSIGVIRKVLVPFPPKFEIFTIESTRIKLKVWDQNVSTNKMAKKEKTEFMVKIAEQINRNVTVSSSDELEEMPGKQPVNGDHPAEDMEEDENGASKVV